MSLLPLSQAVQTNQLQNIDVLATDLDGTLTSGGKLTANLLQVLETLTIAQIDVLIVTGRSAGWVNAIATYLPIRGAISRSEALCDRGKWGIIL
jgi:hypothetical protein